MKVAVIGGGINGLACAWRLAEVGHQVTLFEGDRLMCATSQASSKLLHGGLRYLEQGKFWLVREALVERDKWLRRAPHIAKPLPLIYPIFRQGSRSKWLIALGMRLYRLLSTRSALPPPAWLRADDLGEFSPKLRQDGLVGGYRFYDAQMDDYALGMWVAKQYKEHGGVIREGTAVERVSTDGEVVTADGVLHQFDRVVNVAGPWAQRLLTQSGIPSPVGLDLVRGSHLIVDRSQPSLLVGGARYQSSVFCLALEGKNVDRNNGNPAGRGGLGISDSPISGNLAQPKP